MISVIVPIYNVEKYLSQCIESIMAQTYRDLEIILVEDGSPDRCGEICDDYAAKDHRIRVIHKLNGGVASARNAGLQVVRGEYIGFVDPDDWISAEMYDEMLKAITEINADIVICGYEYCSEDGVVIEERRYQRRNSELLTQKEIMKMMANIPPIARHGMWNKLFRTHLLKGLSFPENLKASEDVWVITEYLNTVRSAIFIHEPYYFNRIRSDSMTHGGLSIHSLLDTYQAHYKMYCEMVSKYPELKDHHQAFLLDAYLLKYNEASRKFSHLSEDERMEAIPILKKMRKAIRTEALRAIFNGEIYWKTRLYYLFLL